ncbi:fatty acid desaturase-domain-containing protein [Syncephalis fuscata]|nr:fatty acid desaturase-domain-containing protein [Syncephalis fuscata]
MSSLSSGDSLDSIPAFDRRYPLYLGDWERSVPYVDDNFAEDDLDEPHFKRKRQILHDHPELVHLYGYDVSTIYVALFAAFIQTFFAFLFGRVLVDYNVSMLIFSYVIGGTATALYGVILHECTHNLASSSPLMNRFCGLVANIGIPVPIAMSFRRYHLEHHTYQGVFGRDPDLPMDWEVRLIRGNMITKFIWVLIYPVMYVVRGAAQGKALSEWEKYNWAWTICTDSLVVYFCGWRGLLYLFLSLWMGYSLHPGAAHFIQEHYTFNDGQETYSYYGSGNKVLMNIGYHNEHHDFAHIPWSRLPAVRRIAPEYYDTLAYHTSWWMVIWRFIMDPAFGPQSRVGRTEKAHKDARKMIRQQLQQQKQE